MDIWVISYGYIAYDSILCGQVLINYQDDQDVVPVNI